MNSMDTFVTIVDFTWPTDAVVPRGLLEDAGIETHLKDELTVQVYNLYSNAVGGVKLQVRAADVEQARTILREAGFLKDGPPEEAAIWLELDRITREIPLLGRIELLAARLLVLVAIVLIIVIVPIAISAQPTLAERITAHDWCVQRVQYNDKDLEVRSTDLLVAFEECHERLTFGKNGAVVLPGLDTERQSASWSIQDGKLLLEELVAHEVVYGAPFLITVDNEFLTLRSGTTTILCKRQFWG
ncbi:MAG TPA: DUF2007 domain-containing protein, partial [Flavobacteriales bacterium]|nr:DUF2007 domain-containing protein [Flavobacteriales bacterium]